MTKRRKEKGVFISDELIRDKNLGQWERYILADIINRHEYDGNANKPQKEYAERFGLDKTNVSKYFKRLLKLGYIAKGDKGRSHYIPTEKVVTATTKSEEKSCSSDNSKLSQQQPEVVADTTTHLINNIKDIKGDKKDTPPPPEKSEKSEKGNLQDEEEKNDLNNKKDVSKKEKSSGKKEKEWPLWQVAAKAYIDFYKENPDQCEVVYRTSSLKNFDDIKNVILKFCAHKCDEKYTLNQIIKNPAARSGWVQFWMMNEKHYNKTLKGNDMKQETKDALKKARENW